MKNLTKYIIIIAGLIFLLAFNVHYSAFYKEQIDQIESTLLKGKLETKRVADLIEKNVASILPAGKKLSEDISHGKIGPHQINDRLKKILADIPQIEGVGVYFLSVDGNPSNRSLLPFYKTRNDTESSLALVQIADIPIVNKDTSGNEMIFGRVVIDVSRWSLKDFLHKGHFGSMGFPFLVNGETRFISHPSEEFDAERKTLFQVAAEQNLVGLKDLATLVMAGRSGNVKIINPDNEVISWIYTAPIPSIGWSVCTKLISREVAKATVSMQRHLMLMFVGIVGFIICLTITLLLKQERIVDKNAWIGMTVISLVLSAGIGAVWYQVRNYEGNVHNDSIPMVEAPMLSHFQNEYIHNSKNEGFDPPIFVPTGLFIQSVSFDSPVDISVTGYVWQNYPMIASLTISPGVIFPEATESEISLAYERVQGNSKVIGWNFKVTLREPFEYKTYPFERENIWIRMWHKDFDKNVILTPDFRGYNTTNPSDMPGIEKHITLPGWDITKSYFSYQNQEYNSNFGIHAYQGRQKFPELFYNIIIRRNFLDPFLANFLPLFLVAVLMFITKLTISKNTKTGDLLGFDTNTVLAGVAALFFIVVYAQIDLRLQISSASLTYLDYYYFAVYLIFLVVSVDAMIFSSTDKFHYIHYRDNLIPKLLYWPATLLFLYIATIWIFYP